VAKRRGLKQSFKEVGSLPEGVKRPASKKKSTSCGKQKNAKAASGKNAGGKSRWRSVAGVMDSKGGGCLAERGGMKSTVSISCERRETLSTLETRGFLARK